MRKGVLLAILLVLACTPLARAESYVGLYGGAVFTDTAEVESADFSDDFETGWLGGAKVGGWMPSLPWLALEGNIWYAATSLDWTGGTRASDAGTFTSLDFDADQVNFSLSALLQYPYGCWRPYAGGGILGSWLMADFQSDLGATDDDEIGWGWLAQAGAEYMVARNISLFGEYRYVWTTYTLENSNSFDIDLASHNVMGGLNFRY